MGIYSQTDYTIQVADKDTANKVIKAIKALQKNDKEGNTYYQKLKVYPFFNGKGGEVASFMDSGRIQNLEYKCDRIWETIKDIKGVQQFSAPFMTEGEGYYNSND